MVYKGTASLMFVFMITGDAFFSPEGGEKAFFFVPARFITSEAFLKRLTKGKALNADAPLPSVLPDSGNPPQSYYTAVIYL